MLRPRSLGLLLLLATLLIYLPTTLNQFVNYDDPDYVVLNPFVNEGLSWMGVKWAFVAAHASNWHPLTWLSHMLDCDLFHLNPAGPHLVNSLFHAANAALLFVLLLRLTGSSGTSAPEEPAANLWPAALVAALFAWHPLHVESVAWISERKDVLSTFFSLLCLLCYARYASGSATLVAAQPGSMLKPVIRDYSLALICFALALLSKPMPVTLPLVMLLLDFWPLKRIAVSSDAMRAAGKLILEKVPFFLLSGLVCVITILSQQRAESSFSNIPLEGRLENVLAAYATYLGKMLWPLHLAIFYPLHPSIPRVWLVEVTLILVGISVIVWRERRANPYLLTGWLWYLVTLLPVIGLIQVGAQSTADRYTYFPLIGIFLAASFALKAIADRFKFLTKWLVAACVAVLIGCVCLTERQLAYWRDSETLFRHSIEVEDNSVARVSLGSALQDKNRQTEAMTQFIIAWRMSPDSMLPNINVADILAAEGKPELAAVYFQRVVPNNTWLPLADENYGRLLVTLKRYDEAMKEFSAAAHIDPLDPRPHFLMARLYLSEGRDQEALAELSKAIELEPQDLQTTLFMASVLASSENAKTRDGTKAKALAQEAVKLTHGQEAAPLDVLAMSCAELGRFPDAVLIEEQAIKVAKAANQQDGLDLLQKHLEFYEKNQPWRETFKTN